MPGVKPYLAITLTSYSIFLRKGKDYYEKEEEEDDDDNEEEEEEEREREWLKKIEKPVTSEADKTLKKKKGNSM